jgi:hypothetical protein
MFRLSQAHPCHLLLIRELSLGFLTRVTGAAYHSGAQ